MNRQMLADARWLIQVAKRERQEGFRDRAAECLRVAGQIRREATK